MEMVKLIAIKLVLFCCQRTYTNLWPKLHWHFLFNCQKDIYSTSLFLFTIRCYLLDIKNTFLHGDFDEEVYIEQSLGYVAQGHIGTFAYTTYISIVLYMWWGNYEKDIIQLKDFTLTHPECSKSIFKFSLSRPFGGSRKDTKIIKNVHDKDLI